MSNLLDKASILLTPTAYSDGTLHSVKPIQTFGSELVTNGGFDTDSNWNTNAGWSISDGKANIDTDNGTLNLTQSGVLVVGKKYKLSLIANVTVGSIKFESGEGDNLVFTSNIDSHIFTADSTQVIFRRQVAPTRGYIDNVSIVEVTDGDFDFTRATTATRVNSSGLIESVASGLPRIDYTGGTGQILLEPQSTNTATYSNDFTQGDIFDGSGNPSLTGAVLSANQGTAPDGTNTAQKLIDNNDSSSGSVVINFFNTNLTADTDSTVSVFAKKNGANVLRINMTGFDSGRAAFFDLVNGTKSGATQSSIEDYGNGWFRCSVTMNTTTDTVGAVLFNVCSNSNQTSITRDGTKSILLWGMQAEEKSFPTSYIPTSGSTVTRNKDEANNCGDTSLINSTEGVLYAEIAAFDKTSTQRAIDLSDGSATSTLRIAFNSSGKFALKLKLSNTTILESNSFDYNEAQFYKVAIKYKSGASAIFVDGVEVSSNTTSYTNTDSLSELNFGAYWGGINFFGKVKCVAVFKEALTDAQLQCLTT